MIDVEPLIIEELELLVPRAAGASDWLDVKRRAGVTARRKRIAFSSVALVAAVFVTAAFTNSFGNFSTWLRGEPGKPASQAEQRAFDQSIRSWVGFPQGTKLRQLAQTTTGGATFTLFGFRGAGSLCLRLDVSGGETVHQLVCPPLAQLRATPQPALVAAADYQVGVGKEVANGPFDFTLPKATVTFGIVADGLNRVDVEHSDGKTTQALVSGNAFLSIDTNISPSERVTHIWAVAGATRVEVRFRPSPSWLAGWPQTTGPQLAVPGPAKVQRALHSGAIRWLARRQARGVAVPTAVHHLVGTVPSVIFAREITPDPSAPERLVVSVSPAGDHYFGGKLKNKLQVCAEVVGGRYPVGGGCWPAGRLFSTAPFSFGVGEDQSGQYATIAGLASDDVSRLVLFTGNGGKVTVPMHDNGYLVEAALADYPLRLVGYDSSGLVIGSVVFKQSSSFGPPAINQPVINGDWKTVYRNDTGAVWVGPSAAGTPCSVVRLAASIGGSLPVCQPLSVVPATGVGSYEVHTNPKGSTIIAPVGRNVAHVVIHFHNGHEQTIPTPSGYAMARLTPDGDRVSGIAGYDASGRLLAEHMMPAGGIGKITRLSSTSISIGTHPTTCRVTKASPPLTAYRIGSRVQFFCQEGVLDRIRRAR